jgi:hypothetical protein
MKTMKLAALLATLAVLPGCAPPVGSSPTMDSVIQKWEARTGFARTSCGRAVTGWTPYYECSAYSESEARWYRVVCNRHGSAPGCSVVGPAVEAGHGPASTASDTSK